MSPFYHALVFARSNNLPKTLTQYSIAMAGAGSVLGRMVAGVLADLVGVWTVFGTIGFASGIVMFAFWTPPNIGTAPTLIGLILFGLVSGAWWSLIASATAAISPIKGTGMRIGMLITCCSVPTLVGPVISGGERPQSILTTALISADGDRWTYAGAFNGAVFVLSGIVTLAPWIRCGRRKPDAVTEVSLVVDEDKS